MASVTAAPLDRSDWRIVKTTSDTIRIRVADVDANAEYNGHMRRLMRHLPFIRLGKLSEDQLWIVHCRCKVAMTDVWRRLLKAWDDRHAGVANNRQVAMLMRLHSRAFAAENLTWEAWRVANGDIPAWQFLQDGKMAAHADLRPVIPI